MRLHRPLKTQIVFLARPSIFSRRFTKDSITRIPIAGKAILSVIGSIGTRRFWTGCSVKDLPLSAFRNSGLGMMSWLVYMTRGSAMLVMSISNLPGQIIVGMNRNPNVCQEILIVNTHLLFPHNSTLCLERLRQVYKILQHVESYQKDNKLNPLPILLCGDWNGSKRGHVYKFLRSQGFVSSYDTAHQYTDADAQKWVSHRNHRGNICGVDFIWLLNPNRYRKLLKTSWGEAVFGMFKYQLRQASLTDDDAFAFLKADSQGDYITFSDFCEALRHLNLIGHCNGLSEEEIKELWVLADIDGNSVVDYKEFKQRIWNASLCEHGAEVEREAGSDDVVNNGTEQTIGFSVKNAVLFPTEVEKGMWPEDYSLSDHARLTVVLSPLRMPCSRVVL